MKKQMIVGFWRLRRMFDLSKPEGALFTDFTEGLKKLGYEFSQSKDSSFSCIALKEFECSNNRDDATEKAKELAREVLELLHSESYHLVDFCYDDTVHPATVCDMLYIRDAYQLLTYVNV
jgi:hypothetical protein